MNICGNTFFSRYKCYDIFFHRGEIATYQKAVFQQEVIKALVGKVVLTRYNNKCYRVDDILFDSNPRATFTLRGEEVFLEINYQEETFKYLLAGFFLFETLFSTSFSFGVNGRQQTL